ncbi:MAG: hypothetical protein HFI93_01500 [Lachnospiraceae bacterium]|nr:hypothetical protein [Lachnospiraceae bacterium]
MKKKWMVLLLILFLTFETASEVRAETVEGSSGWQVVFTSENQMESNFKTQELDEKVSGLLPGDSIVFTIHLENRNENATDWYMTNKVLYSLEDRSANTGTSGGAYTYELIYTDKEGKENVLFSSDTVGGESFAGQEGLHGATDALKDYFFLDSLNQGQNGKIVLRIALDGETQGNDYQNTLADLQMNFAVELRDAPANESEPEEPDTSRKTKVVKTGDETNLLPFYAAMAVSGIVILILAVYRVKRSKQDREEE